MFFADFYRTWTHRVISRHRVLPALLVILCFGTSGCESLRNMQRTPEELAVLEFAVQGFQIGQNKQVLANYDGVEKLPGFRNGMEEFQIFTPAPQISMLALFFRNDTLRRIEIRYFNGPTTRTLSRAGGWRGILQHMESRYGAPSETGTKVPLVSTQEGLQAQYAKFNGAWVFPAIRRQLNLVAMEDSRGGVAVVTVSDTTPEIRRAAAVVRTVQAPQELSDTTTDVIPSSGAASRTPAAPAEPQVLDPGF